eukprot:TRINITY_DN12577_c0_g1_i1.p1 TRINITY_DN12577_c0_g1~~TRINITY_DN12577_c0_g1_i1.p1  ORF type:complete len:398 (-),score=63.92 TRINITY_DN12577_c0_g1_i1:1-1173(-)
MKIFSIPPDRLHDENKFSYLLSNLIDNGTNARMDGIKDYLPPFTAFRKLEQATELSDEVYLKTILNLMAGHFDNKPKHQFLFEFLSMLLKENTSECYNINRITTLMLPQLDINNRILWTMFCSLISVHNNQLKFLTRLEILKKIIMIIQSLPSNLKSSNQFQLVQNGITILRNYSNSKTCLLPIYSIITEVKQTLLEPGLEPHWCLAPFLEGILYRKHALALLLTTTGFPERCRLAIVSRPFVSNTNNNNNVPGPNTWRQFARSICHMLRERQPLDLIQQILEANHDVHDQPKRKSQNPPKEMNSTPANNSHSSSSASSPNHYSYSLADNISQAEKPSRILLDACIMRIQELLEQTQKSQAPKQENVPSKSNQDLFDEWFYDWIAFSLQF